MAEGYKWTKGHLENGGGLQVHYGPLGKWRRATSDLLATWKMAESYKWTTGHLENGGELQVNFRPHYAQLCYKRKGKFTLQTFWSCW